jgi:ABC-type Fe3+ transport system permease subunit
MLSWLIKVDWPLIIRLLAGGTFIWIAITFKDWTPALFGLTIAATGIYASWKKRGCGYEECSRSDS